ncbi:ABC transporter permease [Paenibacillus abyssi]|uniref:ABC transporter permease n=1 Tax=Paenibacillus abyssi TaxID=1340531 RepID=A0A917CXL6_9BACL|nr:ABC transporter permease [Paenibacillus abyssi]GGG01985.1 ABC transporter permease [Paenibacillus abyssi]
MAENIQVKPTANTTNRLKRTRTNGFKAFYFKREREILGGGAIFLFFVVWEILGASGIFNPMFISSPSRVWAAGVAYVESGLIWNDLRISGIEFFSGYLLALIVGVPIGLLMGWYWRVRAILDPFVSFFYSTPRIAFLPVLIIWLGIGMGSKIAIIFMMSVIPFVVNTMTGVRTIDQNLVKVARAFNASDLQIFRTIILPGAIPSIISGLRLGIGLGLIGIVVGEMYAANAGIGYRLMEAGTMFRTDLLFVCVLIIAGIGIAASELLVRVERIFDKWRPDRS